MDVKPLLGLAGAGIGHVAELVAAERAQDLLHVLDGPLAAGGVLIG